MGKEPRRKLPPAGIDKDDEHRPDYSRRYLTREEFGRRLKEHLDKRGWSQSDLARRVDMRRDSIHYYVKGKHLPTSASLERLAKGLGVTSESLLPNAEIHALDQDERPAFSLRQARGAPDKVWLEVNQIVTPDQALRIQQILNERHGGESNEAE